MLKNEWLKKLLLFPALIFLSGLLIGIYGSIHDNIVYSFEPRYFDRTLARLVYPDATGRMSAALDGWISVSSLGLVGGLVFYMIGVVTLTAKQLFRLFLQAIGMLLAIALAVELGMLLIDDELFKQLTGVERIGVDGAPEDRALNGYWNLRFAKEMGLQAGIIFGCVFLIFKVIRLRIAK